MEKRKRLTLERRVSLPDCLTACLIVFFAVQIANTLCHSSLRVLVGGGQAHTILPGASCFALRGA